MSKDNNIWQIEGKIFNFDQQHNLVAFTNNFQSNKIVIFIAGLSDTLLSVPFSSRLSTLFKQKNIQLIIPQFRSMPNYRIHTIDNDIQDLHKLIQMNLNKKITLLGHSTGCQISLLYLQKYGSSNITSVFLQAPCSDVQYQQSQNSNLKQQIQKAKKSKYFQYNDQIWLSQRFLSLYQRNNKEDLLSSYLPDQHYFNWKKYNIPIYAIVSEKDQYVVNSNINKLNLGCQEVYSIKNASHSLWEKQSRQEFYNILIKNI